jgi:hypothetical protein
MVYDDSSTDDAMSASDSDEEEVIDENQGEIDLDESGLCYACWRRILY